MNNQADNSSPQQPIYRKLPYIKPELLNAGKLVDLTNSGGSSDQESGNGVTGCDRLAKKHC
jgi:hypothetical protein